MVFWIVAFALASLAAILLARPLLRGPQAPEVAPDALLYRAQLDEVTRDAARGLIAPAEAERLRTEIARRLLAADRQGAEALAPEGPGLSMALVVALGLVLLGGTAGGYLWLGQPGYGDLALRDRLARAAEARADRPPQAEAEAAVADLIAAAQIEPPPEIAEIVARLQADLAETPDALEGWQMLTDFETRTGNFAAAARAMEQVVRLKGDGAGAEDLAGLVDRLVLATQGVISQEALVLLDRLRTLDPAHPALVYYDGLLDATTGRPDLAFIAWRDLLASAPPEGLHARLASAQIEEVAAAAGIDFALPEAPDPAIAENPQVQAMVQGLADRLAREGGPPEDWARLITSLGVLGRTEAQAAILTEARGLFADAPEALALIEAAAAGAAPSP